MLATSGRFSKDWSFFRKEIDSKSSWLTFIGLAASFFSCHLWSDFALFDLRLWSLEFYFDASNDVCWEMSSGSPCLLFFRFAAPTTTCFSPPALFFELLASLGEFCWYHKKNKVSKIAINVNKQKTIRSPHRVKILALRNIHIHVFFKARSAIILWINTKLFIDLWQIGWDGNPLTHLNSEKQEFLKK